MKPDLQEILVKWQKILRLQDWVITIQYAKHFDLNPDAQGQVGWNLFKKSAHIKVMDPGDYDPSWPFPQDVQKTVVHELLHLHMAPFDETKADSLGDKMLEQAIECISSALVDRDRRAA